MNRKWANGLVKQLDVKVDVKGEGLHARAEIDVRLNDHFKAFDIYG